MVCTNYKWGSKTMTKFDKILDSIEKSEYSQSDIYWLINRVQRLTDTLNQIKDNASSPIIDIDEIYLCANNALGDE